MEYRSISTAGKLTRVLLGVWSALVLLFLIAPILVIVPLSFNAGDELSFPLAGFSLRWFEDFFGSDTWRNALINSLSIGLGATIISVVLGTTASLGLNKLGLRSRQPIQAIVLAPLVVPTVIVGVGIYFVFSELGLTGTYLGLVMAHATLAVPFQVVTTSAALANLDARQIWAAASMGAGPVRTFFAVTLPIAAPGIASGALFSFSTSLDEIVVTLFLGGPGQRTLPREMFTQAREYLTPTIAAAATVMIVFSIALLLGFLLLRNREAT
ncbi:ABC transporter permease [Labrys okinawensis]|uniref:ABC transporter permease n=1 Tax=Labrys okinawensis TaxID=346911 RepID=UPI0039BC2C22